MRAALTMLGLALLAGCPSPPTSSTPGNGGPPGGGAPGGPPDGGAGGPPDGGAGGPPGGNAGGPPGGGAGGPPGGAAAGAGGPPTPGGGIGEAVMRLDMPVRVEQADIEGGLTLSGTVQGDCPGTLVIDLMPPPAGPGPDAGAPPEEGGGPMGGPITRLEMSAAGAFSMKIPAGTTGAVAAVCDSDGDGLVGTGDLGSEAVELGEVTASRSGLVLTLTAASAPGGPPPDAEDSAPDGPPPDAGGAPEGGSPPPAAAGSAPDAVAPPGPAGSAPDEGTPAE